jgi:hypothetical protein
MNTVHARYDGPVVVWSLSVLCFFLATVAYGGKRGVAADVPESSSVAAPGEQSEYSREQFESWNKPMQQRSPVSFWKGKKVFQKRGIVIEDRDYIVKNRYWILDEAAVGDVIDVVVLKEDVRLIVRFPKEKNGWKETGFEKSDQQVSESTSTTTTTIRKNYRGEMEGESDTLTYTYSYKIKGYEVDKAYCGVLDHDDNGHPIVDFPATIVGLQRLTVGDRVVRGPDWSDGYADGGSSPVGQMASHSDEFFGTVEHPRNVDGYVDVKWQKTGRLTAHRFDSHGFYDVEILAPAKADAE